MGRDERMLVRLRSCDNIIAMEALSDQEEVYFQEEEPEVPIDTPHEDEDDRPNYNSCIIRRDNLQTAPLNFRPAKLNCLDRQGVGGTAGEGGRKKQRLEHSASPSKHYEYRSTKKSGGVGSYRTIYSTKKQSSPLPLVSYSPENLTKAHRKSESPNRKSQYWQSWLLEPKLATHNHSAIIPKTLKVER